MNFCNNIYITDGIAGNLQFLSYNQQMEYQEETKQSKLHRFHQTNLKQPRASRPSLLTGILEDLSIHLLKKLILSPNPT